MPAEENNASRPDEVQGSHSLTIRRLSLPFPATIDPVVIEGFPEESFIFIGMSLLLPYLEPYLIRTMQEAKKKVQEKGLLSDMNGFMGQETQHFRQHMQFNEALRLKDCAELKRLEADLAADYRRYSATGTLRFNLAYAEGFEAYTMAMARFIFDTHTLDRLDAATRELFQWHIVEEIEHRTVAFDVYQAVHGSYVYRVAVGLFAQWHFIRFVLRAAMILIKRDRANLRSKYGGTWRSLGRVGSLLGRCTLHLFPKFLATYMPWYSPHRIPMPDLAKVLAEIYTEKSRAGQKISGAS